MDKQFIANALQALSRETGLDLKNDTLLVIGTAATVLATGAQIVSDYIDIVVADGVLDSIADRWRVQRSIVDRRLGVAIDELDVVYQYRFFGYEAAIVTSFYKAENTIGHVHFSEELLFKEREDAVKTDTTKSDEGLWGRIQERMPVFRGTISMEQRGPDHTQHSSERLAEALRNKDDSGEPPVVDRNAHLKGVSVRVIPDGE